MAEFLDQYVPEHQFPHVDQPVLVHGHCHQKAVMGTGAEQTVLAKLGTDVTMLDTGCCGMAGSFGFRKEHYSTSLQVGELALLPAVRKAPKDSVIMSDGFSCRTQIQHLTDRRGLHMAQVMHMALLGERPAVGHLPYPERLYLKRNRITPGLRWQTSFIILGLSIFALAKVSALVRARKSLRPS